VGCTNSGSGTIGENQKREMKGRLVRLGEEKCREERVMRRTGKTRKRRGKRLQACRRI
jgi:hypothetical protein